MHGRWQSQQLLSLVDSVARSSPSARKAVRVTTAGPVSPGRKAGPCGRSRRRTCEAVESRGQQRSTGDVAFRRRRNEAQGTKRSKALKRGNGCLADATERSPRRWIAPMPSRANPFFSSLPTELSYVFFKYFSSAHLVIVTARLVSTGFLQRIDDPGPTLGLVGLLPPSWSARCR